jgi:hypothetical protein
MRGAGLVEIDLCGTPLIPPDARGTTDVGVVQAQLVQEAVRAPDTGGPPVPRSCSGTYLFARVNADSPRSVSWLIVTAKFSLVIQKSGRPNIAPTYPSPISRSDVPHRPVNPRPPGMLRQRRADDSTLQEELVLRRLD